MPLPAQSVDTVYQPPSNCIELTRYFYPVTGPVAGGRAGDR